MLDRPQDPPSRRDGRDSASCPDKCTLNWQFASITFFPVCRQILMSEKSTGQSPGLCPERRLIAGQ